MKTNLILNLDIGLVDQQSMSAEIYVDDLLISHRQIFDQPSTSIDLEIKLPCKIMIQLSGRNNNDTKIDQQGNILQDKYIHLKNIEIFDTTIDSYKIPEKILKYKPDHLIQLKNRFFWNRNGKVILSIDQADPLVWLLKNPELW